MNKVTGTVKHLIIINVIFYIATYVIPNMRNSMLELFALFYPTNDLFKPWQIVSHMFMHGGTFHLIMNMFGLWMFGTQLERLWGKNKFIFFYFSAGIGAALIYTFANYLTDDINAWAVGASGAIMGLVAAYGIYFPNAKMAFIFLPVPVAAKYFIPVLLIYETLSGIFGWSSIFGNIAHFAHVGGAVVGGLIAWYWKKTQFKTN
ncbi:hypothetical protein LPB136_02660 [Tenacibaculum todarodis]|uniref:Peptidase S54 rhomboid domain-containing protein n=1 Tax=Tenacibaculum todarodis TaxID=1850252 RepID=A0A1L3JGS9_9FLAO|nr:rhomboid family intramembrane serine protease [Tenacibaculum todarodis]APG64337.1 hypothetical protein LPB136_02660 [Tenacibaculum todarodis]